MSSPNTTYEATATHRKSLESLRASQRSRNRLVALLSIIVVLATAIALMLPAISATQETLAVDGADASTVAAPEAQAEDEAADDKDASKAEKQEAKEAKEAKEAEEAAQDLAEEPEAAADEKATADAVADDTDDKAADSARDEKQPAVVDQDEDADEQPAADEQDADQPVADDQEEAAADEQVADDQEADDEADEADKKLSAQKFEQKVDLNGKTDDDADDLIVKVKAPEGALPDGTTMKVEVVKDKKTLKAARDEVEKKLDNDVKTVKAVDITFEVDGEPVEPAKDVHVSMRYPEVEYTQPEAIEVVHVDEDGNADIVEQADENTKKDEVTFESGVFSVYALVLSTQYISEDGETYEVTVSYDSEAQIPEGSTLSVSEVTKDSEDYDDYVSRTAEALGSKASNLNYIKLLDITILDKQGNKVSIDAPVDVQINMLDKEQAEETTQVVHFGKEPEVLETSVEGNAVNFTAKSFSIYAVVEDDDTGDYARMNIHFMNGSTEVATMIVKNSDTREELDTIIHDPGVGTIPEGTIFKGWTTKQNYGIDDAEDGMDIKDVRDWAAAKDITENEDVYLYAMLYKNYVINYLDENGVGVGSENVFLLSNDTNAVYTVNMVYTPKDDTHNFEGWNVAEGGSNIVSPAHTDGKLYENGTRITIKGNVTFSVNAPEGHWLVFDENGKGATYNAPVFVKSEDNTIAPPDPTRSGYEFDGWYTGTTGQADDTGYTPVDEATKFTFGGKITDRTVLHAKWKPVSTANYTVIIWKQNLDAEGYDFGESITLQGTTGTAVNTVTQQGTGNNAYARVDGQNKQYEGFHLDHFDQNVTITPEGDAIVNVYYDRNEYTLRFYYARSYNYGNHTYIQVNCNNEGFLRGRANRRNVDQSLTYRSNSGDYARVDGTNTWKDVDVTNAQDLVSNAFINQSGAVLGTQQINNVRTDVVGSNGNVSSGNQRVNTTYYYFDIKVRYEQSLEGLWPTPNEAFNAQTMTSYNEYNDTGYYTYHPTVYHPYTTISPLLVGSYATGANISGKYAVMNPELFVPGESIAYLDIYWRFEPHYEYQYNVYFSTLPGETADTTYKGKGYVLQDDLSYIVANGQGWDDGTHHTAPTDSGQGYWDVDSVTFEGTNRVGRVDINDGRINVYYDRIVRNVDYNDGIYVDGNGKPLDNKKATQLHTTTVIYGTNMESFNEGGSNYWRPDDTDEYVFEGWYLDSEGQHPYTFSGTMPQHDITVYAKWRQKQYRVFLHPNVPESDTSLDWGSGNQQMNFRVSYNQKVSVPTGLRNEYELVGWYTDPECTASSLYSADMLLNESTVTADYDKTKDFTDPMDKYGNGATTNSDVDRPWITKKLDLYAKWRAKLIGANGIGVTYVADPGTNAPTDTNLYLDGAQATAQAAPTPPENQQFVKWVLQTWDEQSGKYVDMVDASGNTIGVYPGDSFEVLKDNAKYVVINMDPVTGKVTEATYTVQLRAEYATAGTGTPTHIYFFANDRDKDGKAISGVVKDGETGANEPTDKTTYANVDINQAVDILSIGDVLNGSQLYKGYRFLGWAKERGATEPWAKLNSDGKYTVVQGNVTLGQVTKIAADERQPIENLYAVWEKQSYKVTIKKMVEGETTAKTFNIAYDFDDDKLTDGSVNLAHNGQQELQMMVPYGTTITLNEDAEGYDKAFTAVRTTDDQGQAIQTPETVTPVSERAFKIEGATTITVTNTRQKGTLKISKATTPEQIAGDKAYKVAVKNKAGKWLQNTQDISFGDTQQWFDVNVAAALEIANLPTDEYTVVEDTTGTATSIEGYRFDRVAYSNDGKAQVKKGETAELTVSNSYTKLVSATVTKKLVDAHADSNKTFSFTATLTEGGNDVTRQYLGSLVDSDGKFNLKPEGDDKVASITFAGIPVGATLTVAETEDSDYTTKVKVAGGNESETLQGELTVSETDADNAIVFTNTRKQHDVKFIKQDADGAGLAGATFDIRWRPLGSAADVVYTKYEDPMTIGEATKQLVAGEYELVETAAPQGYNVLSNKIYFSVAADGTITYTGTTKVHKKNGDEVDQVSVDNDTSTVTIRNQAGAELPNTGGPGTWAVTLAGIALVAMAGVLFLLGRRPNAAAPRRRG